jgi:hypothetical protein
MKIIKRDDLLSKFSLIIGVGTIIVSFINTNILEVGEKCGFDGRIYCLMARGEVVFEPYNRRSALPYLVGLLDFQKTYFAFYLLNLIFLIVSIIFVILISKKIKSKHTYLILAIFLINPHTFRMLFSAPVLVDFLALMLILILVHLNLSSFTYRFELYSFIVLTLLIFVRENLSITYIIALFIINAVDYYREKVSRKVLAFTTLKLMYLFVMTYLAFLQPKIDAPDYVPDTGIIQVVKYWSSEIVASNENFTRFIFLVIFGLGIFGFMGIMQYKTLFENNTRLRILYLFSILLTISSLFLGGDTSRILLIPSVIFTLLFFARLGKDKNLVWLFSLNVFLWVPWVNSNGSEVSFLNLYGQRYLDQKVAISQFNDFLLTGSVVLGVYFFQKVTHQIMRVYSVKWNK